MNFREGKGVNKNVIHKTKEFRSKEVATHLIYEY